MKLVPECLGGGAHRDVVPQVFIVVAPPVLGAGGQVVQGLCPLCQPANHPPPASGRIQHFSIAGLDTDGMPGTICWHCRPVEVGRPPGLDDQAARQCWLRRVIGAGKNQSEQVEQRGHGRVGPQRQAVDQAHRKPKLGSDLQDERAVGSYRASQQGDIVGALIVAHDTRFQPAERGSHLGRPIRCLDQLDGPCSTHLRDLIAAKDMCFQMGQLPDQARILGGQRLDDHPWQCLLQSPTGGVEPAMNEGALAAIAGSGQGDNHLINVLGQHLQQSDLYLGEVVKAVHHQQRPVIG